MRAARARDGIAISKRAVKEGSPQVIFEQVRESPGYLGRVSQAGGRASAKALRHALPLWIVGRARRLNCCS